MRSACDLICVFSRPPPISCESVAVWGGVQIALCVCNFFFTWFLFTNLRRNTEERDYLYRRDLGELFEHYQVCCLIKARHACTVSLILFVMRAH